MKDILLDWYDENSRILPWRALPNETPNPYYVYLSEVLLQQTTVPAVIPYFKRFTQKWPTLEDFALASLDEILHTFQGLGYYSRARNLYKASKLFAENGGIPKNLKELLQYPGIGDYTAKAVSSIAYNQPYIPVDGNVIRVFSRFYGLETPLPNLLKEVVKKTEELERSKRPGDFAQALMDFGSSVCKPKNPECTTCPLQKYCVAYEKKIVVDLPKRIKKQKPPKLYGIATIYSDKNKILLEKNKNNRLLSNLWGVPTTDFLKDKLKDDHLPFIKHVFTHFHLTLFVKRTPVKASTITLNNEQKFVEIDEIENYALSTLMKKVIKKYLQTDYKNPTLPI